MGALHPLDYAVFACLLLLSGLVGPFVMWRDKNKTSTSESYFVGNRALHFIPTAASLFASFWSAISLIGIPAELYTGGAKFFMSIIGQIAGIIIGAFVAVPMMYHLKLISTYQYIELRFGSKRLRKLGTAAGILTSLFSLAVTTYAPCVALEAVSPIPIWVSVIAVAIITMIYTVLGGIKAVVLVDFIQAIVMFSGVLVAMTIGYSKITGGISQAFVLAQEGGRLDFFDFNPDPRNTYSFYAMVIPQIIYTAGVYATSQAAVQRYSALPSSRQASFSVLSMMPQVMILKALLFLLALAMFAYFDEQGCDPLRGKLISNPNQLTTYFVVQVLDYPGLIGLWFAALFSGALSTMSTGYNSVAAIIWEDFLKDKYEKQFSPAKTSIVLKSITLSLGVFSCLLALCFKAVSGSIIKLTMSTVSVFGAAVFIPYFAGALFPFVNTKGTIYGMISATCFTGFMSGGQLLYGLGNEQVWLPTRTDNCTNSLSPPFGITVAPKESYFNPDELPTPVLFMFSLSYFLFPFFAIIAGVIVAAVVSLFSGGLQSACFVDEKFLLFKNYFLPSKTDLSTTNDSSHPCCSLKGSNDFMKSLDHDLDEMCQCHADKKDLDEKIEMEEEIEKLQPKLAEQLYTEHRFLSSPQNNSSDCECDCDVEKLNKEGFVYEHKIPRIRHNSSFCSECDK